jgi:hypothetical protein
MLSNWVSFIAYPNLFAIKGFVVVVVVDYVYTEWISFLVYTNLFGIKGFVVIVGVGFCIIIDLQVPFFLHIESQVNSHLASNGQWYFRYYPMDNGISIMLQHKKQKTKERSINSPGPGYKT